jgi:hypothetical protein
MFSGLDLLHNKFGSGYLEKSVVAINQVDSKSVLGECCSTDFDFPV